MAKKSRRSGQKDNPLAAIGRSDLGKRLLGLVGLAAIVGVAIAIIAASGLLGSQGGGTTESGRKIENVLILQPPPPPGVSDFDVGVSVGKVAKDFEISDFEGNRLNLSDFRGRPVYINFWASWCIPCRIEMPDIAALMDSHPELVTIGVNRAEPLDRAQSFLDSIELNDGSQGMSFTANVIDPNDKLYNEYRGLGMPVSIFVDANGYVTFVWNGLLRLSDMEEVFAMTVESASAQTTEAAPAVFRN